MKNILKYTKLILIAILLYNCGGNDDNVAEDEIVGKWRLVSGSFYNGADKFAYFNNDNTLDVLRETGDHFKGNFNTTYTVSNSKISINDLALSGPLAYSYTLENDLLALSNDFGSVTLQKVTSGAPELSNWIKSLDILDEGNAPWTGVIDMAFNYDKTQILYGNNGKHNYIALIDPITFDEVGQLETTVVANAVEVEKYDNVNRLIFQTDRSFDLFYGVNKVDNLLGYTSPELGDWLQGLASVSEIEIWAASTSESTLYLCNYETGVENTIDIQVKPQGLDYQNDRLYICDGNFLHKCYVTQDFEVLESYGIPNFKINGVAFDGTNFWVNGKNTIDDTYKIIKTSLTL